MQTYSACGVAISCQQCLKTVTLMYMIENMILAFTGHLQQDVKAFTAVTLFTSVCNDLTSACKWSYRVGCDTKN